MWQEAVFLGGGLGIYQYYSFTLKAQTWRTVIQEFSEIIICLSLSKASKIREAFISLWSAHSYSVFSTGFLSVGCLQKANRQQLQLTMLQLCLPNLVLLSYYIWALTIGLLVYLLSQKYLIAYWIDRLFITSVSWNKKSLNCFKIQKLVSFDN